MWTSWSSAIVYIANLLMAGGGCNIYRYSSIDLTCIVTSTVDRVTVFVVFASFLSH
jgi:hypothetical protein